jgi:6-phosphogluconolactonase
MVDADSEELIAKCVDLVRGFCETAVSQKGSFTISLSGGSTPKAIFERLVSLDIDWSKVYFFFGDERCVPPTAKESNFRMANEAMLSPLGISDDNIFRWRTELGDPEAIAADYERTLADFFAGVPRFDLCLLGLGPDAHTASLFPGTRALSETKRIAVANRVEKLGTFRLTLTPPALNNSDEILFIATGAEKAEAVHAVIEGDSEPEKYPAQLIKPSHGRVQWLIDEPAAALLMGE